MITLQTTMTATDRAVLEAAYLASVPERHRASTRQLLPGMSDEYLRMRLGPAPRIRRGPRMARHANDGGVS
jgi:hypothetical protein